MGANRNSLGHSGSTGAHTEVVPEIEFDCAEGEAIQIVSYDPRSRQFVLNDEGVNVLLEYAGNVGFVCIAGKYRTGKSFLMNKLLGLKGGVSLL